MFRKNGANQHYLRTRSTFYVLLCLLIGLEPAQVGATESFDSLQYAVLDTYDSGEALSSGVPDKKFAIPDPDPAICEDDSKNKNGVSLKHLVAELVNEKKVPQMAVMRASSTRSRSVARKSSRRSSSRPPAGITKASGKVVSPLPSYSTAAIRRRNAPGCRLHPILKKRQTHHGMDMAAPTGTTIVSVMDGEVVYAGRAGGYGNLVTVRHVLPNGKVIYSKYGHMHVGRNCKLPRVGTKVSAGQKIGCVGSTGRSTGPHLHFEIRSASNGGATYDSKHFVLNNGELKSASSCGGRRKRRR